MLTLIVLYPDISGSQFNMDYYLSSHLPMMQRLMGSHLASWSVNRGLPGVDGQPGPYQIVTLLNFPSGEDFQSAMANSAEQGFADVPNFTNIQPVMLIVGEEASHLGDAWYVRANDLRASAPASEPTASPEMGAGERPSLR